MIQLLKFIILKSAALTLPVYFDSTAKWYYCNFPISNQQQCYGGGWDFASTYVLSQRLCIASNGIKIVSLSPEYLLVCDTLQTLRM